MKRRRTVGKIVMIVSLSGLLSGCGSGRYIKDIKITYPYRVVENTSLTKLGYLEAGILNETTFRIGDNKFTLNDEKTEIKEIELPKLTDNTKENYGDNIINMENLAIWQSKEDISYEKYKNALTEANVYVDAINQINNLAFSINSNDYSELDDTAYMNGVECNVIQYRDTSDLGVKICNILGCDEVTEINKDNPVYITYMIDDSHNILYVGADASRAISYTLGKDVSNMILEVYKDIDSEGDRVE